MNTGGGEGMQAQAKGRANECRPNRSRAKLDPFGSALRVGRRNLDTFHTIISFSLDPEQKKGCAEPIVHGFGESKLVSHSFSLFVFLRIVLVVGCRLTFASWTMTVLSF